MATAKVEKARGLSCPTRDNRDKRRSKPAVAPTASLRYFE